MSEYEKLIKEYKEKGCSDEQIADEMSKSHPDMKPEEMVSHLHEFKKNEKKRLEVKRLLKEREDKDALEEKIAKQEAIEFEKITEEAKKRAEAKAKSTKFPEVNILDKQYPATVNNMTGKYFCHINKKFMDGNVKPPEWEVAFNNQLKALADGDEDSFKAIQKEITAYNRQHWKITSKANVSDVGASGEFYIPTNVSDMLYSLIYEQSMLMSMVNTVDMVTNDIIIPSLSSFEFAPVETQDTTLSAQTFAIAENQLQLRGYGVTTAVSNVFISQRTSILDYFIQQYMSSWRTEVDTLIPLGVRTGSGTTRADGIFQSLSTANKIVQATDLNLSDLTTDVFARNSVRLSNRVTDKVCWIGNKFITQRIGQMKLGDSDYPAYPEVQKMGDKASCMLSGYMYIEDNQIPNTFTDGLSASTGGTNRTCLFLQDMRDVFVGLDRNFRIDYSEHSQFEKYQTQIRMYARIGIVVIDRPANTSNSLPEQVDLGGRTTGIGIEVATA